MPPNTTPVFTLTPHISSARTATANTNRDGTGTLATVATGQANGTRIDRVTIEGTGASTTPGMVRFYLDDGAGNIRLIKEIPVTAATPSATVLGFFYEWVRTDTYPVEVLPNGWMLKAAPHNAEQFDIVAHGGDF